MGTTAVYNGFGSYEDKDGQKGITLLHGGVPFWFPFEEVTYLPDYTMRNLDEAESIFETGDEARLVYKTFRLSGERLAEELLETQVPVKNSEKGLLLLPKNTPKTQNAKSIFAGVDEWNTTLYVDIFEVEPREIDIAEAKRRALQFKQDTIKGYFQSKRERMSGGAGYFIPTGMIRVFMEELGVQDIDDVFAAKNKGDNNDLLARLVDLLTPKQAVPAAQPQAVPVAPPAAPPMTPKALADLV